MGRRYWIYIVSEDVDEAQLVKVGISQDPQGRVRQLQAGCPLGNLHVVKAFGFSDPRFVTDLEKYFHRWKKTERQHREWFRITPEDAVQSLRQHIFMSMREGFEDDCDSLVSAVWDDDTSAFVDLAEFKL